MHHIQIWYRLANDMAGKYRWWTTEMEQVGQFEHADTIEELENMARALVPVELNLVED